MKRPRQGHASPMPLVRLLAVLLLAGGLGLLPGRAQAATSKCSTSSAASISLGNVTVPPNTPVGASLGTPSAVSITFNCTNIPSNVGSNLFIQAGNLAARDPADPPAGGGILFATSVPGIALRLTGSPDQASSQSCLRCGPGSSAGFEIGPVPRSGSSGNFTETFTGQLVKTGPVGSGPINGIQLMQFWWYEYGLTRSSGPMSTALTLNGGVTVTQTICSVNGDSKNLSVTLPAISTAALNDNASPTAGRTRFNINLTCQPGSAAYITLATSTPGSATGVIAPSGTAGNVGVQLLDPAFNPIPFNTATAVGSTVGGTTSLPLVAALVRAVLPHGLAGRLRQREGHGHLHHDLSIAAGDPYDYRACRRPEVTCLRMAGTRP